MKRILIVEDHDDQRRLLARILASRGFHVVTAACVKEAIAALCPDYEWVLLDLNLPDGTGRDVAMELVRRGLPCRVCVCSANSDPKAILQDYEPDAYCPKPYDLDHLLYIVSTARAEATQAEAVPA